MQHHSRNQNNTIATNIKIEPCDFNNNGINYLRSENKNNDDISIRNDDIKQQQMIYDTYPKFESK